MGAGPEGTDHVYLSDFGLTEHTRSLSGLTHTEVFMGAIENVAPEQIAGKGVDAPTSMPSPAFLYQCLTGTVPFPREQETAALFANSRTRPRSRPSSVPSSLPGIDDAIGRAMAKQREERFDGCTDVNHLEARCPGPTPVRSPWRSR